MSIVIAPIIAENYGYFCPGRPRLAARHGCYSVGYPVSLSACRVPVKIFHAGLLIKPDITYNPGRRLRTTVIIRDSAGDDILAGGK